MSSETRRILASKNKRTFKEMQKLVMAMADFVNSRGKKTWLGKDKAESAHTHMVGCVMKTLDAMHRENIVSLTQDSETITSAIREEIFTFSLGFPNWKEAYDFARSTQFEQAIHLLISALHKQMGINPISRSSGPPNVETIYSDGDDDDDLLACLREEAPSVADYVERLLSRIKQLEDENRSLRRN